MRYAVITRNHHCKERSTLEAYLPGNYEVLRTLEDAFIIGGQDSAGWGLDTYVIPRLASGIITARELTPVEVVEYVRGA